MNSQFALFRIIFGTFLTWHFLALLPYGAELFSNEGLISDPSLNPTYGLFPNPLYVWDSPTAVAFTIGLAIAASITFTLGWARRTSAVILWFILTALFHRNNLTSNPSLPYLGLILILTVMIPAGENFSLARRNENWQMPKRILPLATFLLGIGYTFSGGTKLFSPSWIDGSALAHVLNNPLARTGFFRDFLLQMPDSFLAVMTWVALAAELLYLPLSLSRKARPWIWLLLLGMHLALILLIDFADLSLGMVMIHLFTFDRQWLKSTGPARIGFDADCLMCNRFLAFLAREDQEEQLTFEPLPDDDPKTSMIVRHDSRGTGVSPVEKTPPTAPPGETPGFLACNLTRESNAVLVILESLGGHWRALAILGRLIPRPIRDFLYRIVAKNRHRFGSRKACALPSAAVRKRLVKSLVSVSAIVLVLSLTSCLVTERPPGGNHLGKPDAAFSEVTSSDPALIQTGDVIAFHMPRKEAWAHLKKGKIQKIPYQLFDYGHLALVVDHPDEPRLLQLAMKQAANIDSGLDYLDDKQWTVFRPTTEIDKDRLKEFVEVSLSRLDDPKEAYDFSGVIGFHNRTTTPDKPEEIAKEYTCVTLIQAALHYAGHRTRSIHRKGFLDIVTPAQFIESGNEKH